MNKLKLVLSFVFFSIPLLLLSECKSTEAIPSRPDENPVERMHMNDVNVQSLVFYNKSKADYKLLLDKNEISVALFLLKKGEEIPLHFHKVNKAVYIYEGKLNTLSKNKLTELSKGDSMFIPARTVSKLSNSTKEVAKVLFFFPTGYFKDLEFSSPSADIQDTQGNQIQILKEKDVPWENWAGKLPLNALPTPLAWKTIIDNDSMVMGITKIDPGHDVDSHFHKPTQIVIFSDGEGKTHIAKGEYKEIVKDSYIYPPSYSMHHSINTNKTKPLMEVYFFPTGPFEKIKYLGKGEKYW
ncbi:MAG: cupin domain-containing protein [Leptospiraceae bacterium]|nr:cupin domain-containing protein [Leptospiraceae bacterium]